IIGVSRQRARCHVGESPTEAKRLRLRSKGGAVARKQDGGALRQHARKECARSIRLQRTVNAYVASLHVLYPVAETVDNARRQQGPTKRSPKRRSSPAGYQRRHDANDSVSTGETLDARGIAFGKMMLPKRARMDSTGWHRLAWRRCHGRLRGDFRGFGRPTDGKRETA